MDEVDREEARNPDFDEIEEEKISNKLRVRCCQVSALIVVFCVFAMLCIHFYLVVFVGE